MFIPLVTKKGDSPIDAPAGSSSAAMTIVSITALLLAGRKMGNRSHAAGREAGAFLFFVSILTATSVSAGVQSARARKHEAPHTAIHGTSGCLPC